MGCHTWFYKKIKGPTKAEAAGKVEEAFQKEVKFLQRLIDDRESIDQDLLEAYPEWTAEFAQEKILFWNEQIGKIQSGFFTEDWIFERYLEMNMSIQSYIPGKGWYDSTDELPHDLFRHGGYPDDTLHSLEETLTYIKKNKCTTYEYTEESLKEFWNNHPEGMINFG
jgi:hypothetical protein